MADLEEDEDRERYHELLIKLKKTTEGLLAAHTAQGVWGTYGGLRRICLDTEAILCHRIKKSRASSESYGSFWQFVQSLKWLSPSLASIIDKLNRHSQARRLGDTDMGRAWLRESVQDHTLMTQLDILISDEKHLHYFYHDDAFLCQPDYVMAMRICFRAIELGKPALLSEISPYLLRSGQVSSAPSRSSSLPINRAYRQSAAVTTGGQSAVASSLQSGINKSSDMGNKHTHLNVTYSSQLSSSNLSLVVDPSLGASSLLHQKTLSDPYFVSSLDSPGVLENLRLNPFTDAIRNSSLAEQLQNSHLHSLHPSSQLAASLDNNPQVPQEINHLGNLAANLNGVASSVPLDQSENPPIIVVSSVADTIINSDNSSSDVGVDVSPGGNEVAGIPSLSHLPASLKSETALQSNVEYGSTEGEPVIDFSGNEITGPLIMKPHKHKVKMDGSHGITGPQAAQIQFSEPDSYARLNSSVSTNGVGHSSVETVQPHRSLGHEVPIMQNYITNGGRGPHLFGDPPAATGVHAVGVQTDDRSTFNFSGNSNYDFVNSAATVNNSSASGYRSVPSSSSSSLSKSETSINLLPGATRVPSDFSDEFVKTEGSMLRQNNITALTSVDSLKPKIISVKSEPAINISHPIVTLTDSAISSDFQASYSEVPSPGPYSSARPWNDADLYKESMVSPSSSPVTRMFPGIVRSSGQVYMPHSSAQVTPEPMPATKVGLIPNVGISKQVSQPPPQTSATRRLGHKRWVSDTSAIRVDQFHQEDSVQTASTSSAAATQNAASGSTNGKARRRASEFEPPSYQGTFTKPTEGQSLMSYLTSQDFNTCANLEKENAHFRICEALIEAFESMKFTRMMKRQETGKSKSSSGSSSDEEIRELRQRIRIRKREKMMAKVRPFPSLSDEQTDTTNSQTASSPVSSDDEMSSFSGESESDEDGTDGRNIDLTMSADNQNNLTAIKSSGLNLSMASLYSDAELLRSNQQLEKNSSHDESTNPGSAESIAISLLRKFSEKHLPKASELTWLVSECDAPQRLLPLPSSTPVSPDDAENADLSTNRTRLRGNLEWAPPRAQIIFSVHPPEKRATLMNRQNFRCAGCGMRVDPAFMKRYRYCEYFGKFFCQCCHTGETSIIPGRVIEKWDFSRYPVANFSYALVEKMWQEPLFHVDTINPTLYKRVRGLETIRECRQQVVHLHSLLAICKRDPLVLKEMHKMPSHWINNDDVYSMDDFIQVKNGTMLSHLRYFISLAVAHVSDCQLCQGLGFICGMCQDQHVIFPFQLEHVIKCSVCQSCYHKECFIPEKCPKCIRLEARRRLQQEPLSPDSPDSGESDESKILLTNMDTDSSPSPLVGSADDCR
ncbi:hypothetical protein BsWGS_09166 [Bradybaena similaris]